MHCQHGEESQAADGQHDAVGGGLGLGSVHQAGQDEEGDAASHSARGAGGNLLCLLFTARGHQTSHNNLI